MFNYTYYYVDQMTGDTSAWQNWATGLFTLAGVVLGFYLPRWIGNVDRRRKDKKTTSDLLTEIKLLEEPMRGQLEAIKGFVERLRSEKDDVIVLSTARNLNLDRLKSLDRAGLVDHLNRSTKDRDIAIQRANRALIQCDAITERYEAIRQIALVHTRTSARIKKGWNKEVGALERHVSRLILEDIRQGKDLKDDHFLDSIRRMTRAELRAELNDIYKIQQHIFIPLMVFLGTHHADPRTDALIELNEKIKERFHNLKDERLSTANQFEMIENFMESAFENLQAAADDISTIK